MSTGDIFVDYAENGDIKRIMRMLENGIDPNISNLYGVTALISAVENLRNIRNYKIVKLLLDNGADPNLRVRNGFGWTPLIVAAKSLYDNTPIVKLLLDRGAKINLRSGPGRTALILATMYGNIDNVRMLLEHGANPLLKDDNSNTAYDIAIDDIAIDNIEIAQLLKHYMRIYRIQALQRGNLTRRKLHTSMARKRSTTSQLGDEYGLGEDIIHRLNSHMTRPTQVDMIDEIPRNMRETLDREPESDEIDWEEIFRENPEQSGSGKRKTKKRRGGKKPCWNNYKMVGMKSKNGKMVPNCVYKKVAN